MDEQNSEKHNQGDPPGVAKHAVGLGDVQVLPASDRVTPSIAMVIGSVFSLGIYLFLASLAVFTVFFESNVVQNGSWIVAPLLMLVAAVPVFGILVFEYAYSRALAGFRYMRGLASRRVQAAAGGFTLLIISFVYPTAGLAGALGAGLGSLILLGLSRLRRHERMWDFVPSEAAAIFSGRDRTGMALASVRVNEHALAPATVLAFTALTLVMGYGVASYLTTTRVIDPNAVTAVALLNALAAHAILAFVRDGLQLPPVELRRTTQVEGIELAETEEADDTGLRVKNLTVLCHGGRALLSEVSFSVPPGIILGVDGESGAGKSLLLSVMSDPFSLEDVQVRGRVCVNGTDLWRRDGKNGIVPAVHVTDDPLLLPASGQNNLSCFHDGQILEQAKRNLERLVFSSDLVNEICEAPDATRLPSMQRKTLALARALTLSPSLYLFDRPEDGLPEKQIAALLGRLQDEIRLGRSALIITQNRAILDACDKLMVLQNGRIVDLGTAEDIRSRQAAGWARFVAERSLEIEENLEVWIRSHFKRPGDEPNRRKVAQIASEMLALSCQGSAGQITSRNLIFEFKHFMGHCVLRMQDDDAPITAAALQKAGNLAEQSKEGVRLTPLAAIISASMEVEAGVDLDRRVLSSKIETFDPRLSATREVNEVAHT